jgi:formylglycine-generating enzyme required for sulfatase activity
MKNQKSNSIFQLSIIGLLLFYVYGCEKPVSPELLPQLTTTEVTIITEASAVSGGQITGDGGYEIATRGVCWSTNPNPTTADSITKDAAGTGRYVSKITGLKPNTTYYLRAYATNKKGTAYGLQETFTTQNLGIVTKQISDTTINSAKCGGVISIASDSTNIIARGVCWNTQPNPTILNSKTMDGKGAGEFNSLLTELTINTTYYVRAYITNSGGTYYGNELSFKTEDGILQITTSAASSIKANSATVSANIPEDEGAPVTERGFCISQLPNPTTDNKISNGSGKGSFATNFTGLTAGVTYYVRAYAINSVGTSYGNEINFKTLDGVVSLSTTSATAITSVSATSGGNITNDGGSAVTARGVCWSSSPNPTIADSKTSNGSGTGSFSSSLTGLTHNSKYYLRAYATNDIKTYYGQEVSFNTLVSLADKIQTALIPAGTFTMGSPSSEVNRSSIETQHSVMLSAFRMTKYEITNSQYAEFLKAKSIGSDGKYAGGAYPSQTLITNNSTLGLTYNGSQWIPVSGYENSPVINVTWYGATEFAIYVGGALPTESQWEYACRGGTTTPFRTGSCLHNTDANYVWQYPYNACNNTVTSSPGKTQAVGTYAANAYGLYDMHGNVWEWCSDWYGTYPTTAQTNPTGPAIGSYRVIRGGGWDNSARNCRSAHRYGSSPDDNANNIGFRVAFGL